MRLIDHIKGIALVLLACSGLAICVALVEHYLNPKGAQLTVAETSAAIPERLPTKVRFDDLLPTSEASSVRHTDDGAIVLSVEKLYIWDPIVCDGVLDFQLRRPTSDEPTTETAALDAPEVLYE